jgi:hypothetical protein
VNKDDHLGVITLNKGNIMSKVQQLELDAHRREIVADMLSLVEKYRKVLNWDIPENNQKDTDRLILTGMFSSLGEIAIQLAK